jgi:hypothetical protein
MDQEKNVTYKENQKNYVEYSDDSFIRAYTLEAEKIKNLLL